MGIFLPFLTKIGPFLDPDRIYCKSCISVREVRNYIIFPKRSQKVSKNGPKKYPIFGILEGIFGILRTYQNRIILWHIFWHYIT